MSLSQDRLSGFLRLLQPPSALSSSAGHMPLVAFNARLKAHPADPQPPPPHPHRPGAQVPARHPAGRRPTRPRRRRGRATAPRPDSIPLATTSPWAPPGVALHDVRQVATIT